jgi:phage repressor protein C with HTH and peptisase S24 domain
VRDALKTTPEKLRLHAVSGDSMEPTLRHGDLVLVDISAQSGDYRDGIWMLGIGDAVKLKRLQRIGVRQYTVSSDNKKYPEFSLDETAALLGRVIWSGRPH